jgi:hypothetical protein
MGHRVSPLAEVVRARQRAVPVNDAADGGLNCPEGRIATAHSFLI